MASKCRSFGTGEGCRFGRRCKFTHECSGQGCLGPCDNTDCQHTRVCKFFKQPGSCKRGTSCKFVHRVQNAEPPAGACADVVTPTQETGSTKQAEKTAQQILREACQEALSQIFDCRIRSAIELYIEELEQDCFILGEQDCFDQF
jgi:hypothetical protein